MTKENHRHAATQGRNGVPIQHKGRFAKQFFVLAMTAAIGWPALSVAKYPDEPIELVVSYAPGGISDLIGRSFARAAERHLDGKVVVQNRAGAAGIVGTDHVYNAKPDGYTLLMARIAVLAVAPELKKVPYDPAKFTYIGLLATDPYACVTSARKSYKTLDDLKAAIKEKNGKVTYSSSGVGSLNHFAALRVVEALNVGDPTKVVTHVPSQGEGPALTAVAGGHIDFFCGNVGPIVPQIESGNVRGLFVTSEKRLDQLKDVPTATELGLPELTDIVGWSAIVGPPGMDKDAVAVLDKVMQDVKNDDEWRQFTTKIGSVPHILSPADTKAFVQKQSKIYGDMVKRLGLAQK